MLVKDEEEVRLEILAGIQKVNRKAVSNAQKVCYTSLIKLLKITKKNRRYNNAYLGSQVYDCSEGFQSRWRRAYSDHEAEETFCPGNYQVLVLSTS